MSKLNDHIHQEQVIWSSLGCESLKIQVLLSSRLRYSSVWREYSSIARLIAVKVKTANCCFNLNINSHQLAIILDGSNEFFGWRDRLVGSTCLSGVSTSMRSLQTRCCTRRRRCGTLRSTDTLSVSDTPVLGVYTQLMSCVIFCKICFVYFQRMRQTRAGRVTSPMLKCYLWKIFRSASSQNS